MILRILCLFPLLLQKALGATASAKIQSINVNCEEDGMGVDIQFDQAFHGVIFSKNFFSSSDCNYVNNPGKDKVHFTIRAGQCGTVQGPPDGPDAKRTRRSVNDTLLLLAAGANSTARQSRAGDGFPDFSKFDGIFALGGASGRGSGFGSSMYENSREDQPPPEAMEFTGGASQPGGQGAPQGAAVTPDQSAQYAGSQVSALGQMHQPNPSLPVPQTGSLQQMAGMTGVAGNQIGQALTQQVNYAQQPLNHKYGSVNGLYPAQNMNGPIRVMSFNGAPQPPSPPNPQYNQQGQAGQQPPPGAYPATANYQYQPNQYQTGQQAAYDGQYPSQPAAVPGAYRLGQLDPLTGEEITTTVGPIDDAYAYVPQSTGQLAADAERPLLRSGNYNNAGTAYNVNGFSGVDRNSAGFAVPSGRQYGGGMGMGGGDQYGGGMPPAPAMPQMPAGMGGGGYGGQAGMQMPPAPQMPDMGGYGGGQQGSQGGYGGGMQMPAAPPIPQDGGQGGAYGGGQGMMQMPQAPQMPDMNGGGYGVGQSGMQMPQAPQMPGADGGQYGGGGMPQQPALPAELTAYQSGSQTGGSSSSYDSGASSNQNAYNSGSQNTYDSGAETVAPTPAPRIATQAPTTRRAKTTSTTPKQDIDLLSDTDDDNHYLPPSTTSTTKRISRTTTSTTTTEEGDDTEYLPETTTAKQAAKRLALTTRARTTTTTTEDAMDVKQDLLNAESNKGQLTITSQQKSISAGNNLPALRAVLKNTGAGNNGQVGDGDSTRDQNGRLAISLPAQVAGAVSTSGNVNVAPAGNGGVYSAEPNQPRDQYDAKYETQNEPTGLGNAGQEPAFGYHEPAGQFNKEPTFGYNEPKFGYNTKMENGGGDQSGIQEPAFGYNEPKGQFNNEPKFGYNEPVGRFNQEPRDGYHEPGGMAGLDQSGGGQEPTFGYNEPTGLANVDRSGGGREPAFGYREPGFGYKEPGFGYNEPKGQFNNEPAFGYHEPAGGVMPENGGAFQKDLSGGPGASTGVAGRSQGAYGGGVPTGAGGSYGGGVAPVQQGGTYGGGQVQQGAYSGSGAQQGGSYNAGATGGPQGGGAYGGGSGAQQGASYNGGAAVQQDGGSYGGGSAPQQAADAYSGGSVAQQSGGSYGSGEAQQAGYNAPAQQQQSGYSQQGGSSGSSLQSGGVYGSGSQQSDGGYNGGSSQQGAGAYDSGSSGSVGAYDSASSGSSQQSGAANDNGSSQQSGSASGQQQQRGGSSQAQQSASKSGGRVKVAGSVGAASSSKSNQKVASSLPALSAQLPADDSDSDDDSVSQQQSGASTAVKSQNQKQAGSSISVQQQTKKQSASSSSQQQTQDDGSSKVMSSVQKGQSSSKSVAASKGGATGSAADSSDGGYIENVIIIQNDPLVQEVWDAARAIRCEWRSNYKKTVSTKERIALTEVQTMRFAGDDIEVWMEIQAGKGPWADPVSNIVPIGHTMTLLIGANDPKHEFDLRVGKCIAHDGSGKSKIDLTDDNGCVVRDRIMSKFDKAKNWGAESATIAFAHFSAFKFPETTKVFIECDVEVCKRGCAAQCTTKSKTGKLDASRHVSVGSGPSSAVGDSQIDSVGPARLGEKFRRKRSIKTDQDTLSVKNHYEAVAPADLSFNIDIRIPNSNGTIVYSGIRKDDSYCMSKGGFGVGVGILITAVIVSTLSSIFLCLRFKNQRPLFITE